MKSILQGLGQTFIKENLYKTKLQPKNELSDTLELA